QAGPSAAGPGHRQNRSTLQDSLPTVDGTENHGQPPGSRRPAAADSADGVRSLAGVSPRMMNMRCRMLETTVITLLLGQQVPTPPPAAPPAATLQAPTRADILRGEYGR